MKEWTTYHLEDICKEILSGGDAAKYDCVKAKSNTYKYPVFANAIDEDGLYGYCNDYVVNVPSVTIAARGAGTGYVAYRDTPYTPIVRLISLIPKENVNPLFLYYRLKIANLRGDGSAIPQLTVPMVKKLKVTLPDYETQKTIANILRSLDVKIQLNKQINDNLEQQAQAIYKSWFVDFEPFKDQEFVDSEIGLIPENWNCTTLSEFISIKYGKDHKKLADGIIPVFGSGGLMRYVDTKLHEGESVLIPRKGSLNNVMYVNEAFWTVDTMFYSTPKVENSCIYAYLFLANKDLASMNAGSAVPSMTTDILNNMPIIAPPIEVLKQFNNICNVYFSRIHQNNIENANLAKQRDTLLPKLMSGELKINEIDC